jgi:uncharacterized NAD-dependent epimerase/dehydratase family protein
MRKNAIILTGNLLKKSDAKTAHGLIRSSFRYNIVGVIDNAYSGHDAGELIENRPANIHVYSSVQDFIMNSPSGAEIAIVGIAVPGGKIPGHLFDDIKESIKAGMSVVSGLHEYLSDIDEIKKLADENNVNLIDIRKSRPKNELKFWSGDIFKVRAPVIAVLGTDCAVGKRTTAVMLTDELVGKGINAQMVFTGQTGWLQGHKYGFILDSTYNDFISGELENAVVTCYYETNADIIILEGQSSLCNPAGPCGSEYLLSARAKGVILQHDPSRKYYEDQESNGIVISLEREVGLIKLYGSEVMAITLNTGNLSFEKALEFKELFTEKFNIPVVLPLYEGAGTITGIVEEYIKSFMERCI